MRQPDASNQQDRVWLNLVAQGGRQGEKALEGLFKKYADRLMAFLMKRGMREEDAEERVLDTFMNVERAAATFRDEATVMSWIYQIAKNKHLDFLRKNDPETLLDEDGWVKVESKEGLRAAKEQEQEQERICAAEGLQECYDRALAAFGRKFPDCAEAIQHIVRDGWSVRDLALVIKRTEGATREYLSQCRKRLKDFVDPCRRFLSEV